MRGSGCFKDSILLKVAPDTWDVVWPGDPRYTLGSRKSRRKKLGRQKTKRDSVPVCEKCGAALSPHSKFLLCANCRSLEKAAND